NLPTARKYAEKKFEENGTSLSKAIPNFDRNYALAKYKAGLGHTKRHDMPVIDEGHVRDLQRRLVDGAIDITKPYSPDTNPRNPFPEGLTGEQAKKFLVDGFHDHNLKDDQTKCSKNKVVAKDLIPIQKQIYLDKCIDNTAKAGIANSKEFLSKSLLILSNDNHI